MQKWDNAVPCQGEEVHDGMVGIFDTADESMSLNLAGL